MIRVTVELLVRGSEENKRTIAVAEIANDGTGTLARGNYEYTLSTQGRGRRKFREGRVEGFERKRWNVWYLMSKVLRDALN